MFTFQCPHCGRSLKSQQDPPKGRRVSCPKCDGSWVYGSDTPDPFDFGVLSTDVVEKSIAPTVPTFSSWPTEALRADLLAVAWWWRFLSNLCLIAAILTIAAAIVITVAMLATAADGIQGGRSSKSAAGPLIAAVLLGGWTLLWSLPALMWALICRSIAAVFRWLAEPRRERRS